MSGDRMPAWLMGGDEKVRCDDGSTAWVAPEVEYPGEQQAPVWTGRWVLRVSEGWDKAVLTAEARDRLVELLDGLPFGAERAEGEEP